MVERAVDRLCAADIHPVMRRSRYTALLLAATPQAPAASAVAGPCRCQSGGRVVNTRGNSLVPGLWDMHVHLGVPPLAQVTVVANGRYFDHAALEPLTVRRDVPRTDKKCSGLPAVGLRAIGVLAAGVLAASPLRAQDGRTADTMFAAGATPAGRGVITATDVRCHLGVIAHDSMRGRATPSRGLEQTAQYVTAQFRALGLVSVGDNGGWVQWYQLPGYSVINESRSVLVFEGKPKHGNKPVIDESSLPIGHALRPIDFGSDVVLASDTVLHWRALGAVGGGQGMGDGGVLSGGATVVVARPHPLEAVRRANLRDKVVVYIPSNDTGSTLQQQVIALLRFSNHVIGVTNEDLAAFAARMRRHGTWTAIEAIGPATRRLTIDTLLTHLRYRPRKSVDGDSAYLRLVLQGYWLEHSVFPRDMIPRVQRAGFPLIIAGHTGAPEFSGALPPGIALHSSITSAYFVEQGLTPLTALQAVTLNPAKYLDGTDSLGTTAPGKLADLVLLDADPLADIANVAMIRAVVANGWYFDRAALNALAAEAKRRIVAWGRTLRGASRQEGDSGQP